MTFVSLSFALFFCVAFVAFWKANQVRGAECAVRGADACHGQEASTVRLRNAALVGANLVFYALVDLRTLPLLVAGIAIVYALARAIASAPTSASKRGYFVLGLVLALLPLVFLKYAVFLLGVAGTFLKTSPGLVSSQLAGGAGFAGIGLSVGISFFTFAELSYLVDVYRGVVVAERQFLPLLAYLSFFPVALCGPIERATTLLPQLKVRATVTDERLRDGVRQFLWGAIKKMVVADGLALAVAAVFDHAGQASGLDLGLAAVLFSIQIYCDFSGYSDMALGMARLLGIELTRNFACPYFSRDIAEFWRRWHISLSSWFRDYVFFPLGANYRGRARWAANIIVTFALCGLWHGANWTFVAWGVLMGLYFLPLVMFPPTGKRSRTVAHRRTLPSPKEALQIATTFALVTLAWMPFRAPSLGAAATYLRRMVTGPWTTAPLLQNMTAAQGGIGALMVPAAAAAVVFAVEWIQRERAHGLAVEALPPWVQSSIAYALVVVLLVAAPAQPIKFLYADF